MLREVIEDVLARFTNRSEVIGTSARAQSKNAVELLELALVRLLGTMIKYLSKLLLAGLVNGAENSQSLVCEATKQRNDAGCTLAV